MIGLLLNRLGVVKRSQDGEVNDRPRRWAVLNSRGLQRRTPRMSSMTD